MTRHPAYSSSFCLFLAVVVLTAFTSCTLAAPPDPAASDRQVANLFAFTRLYGYVRYFHPSEQASRIDWEKFAIYGAERVAASRGPESTGRSGRWVGFTT